MNEDVLDYLFKWAQDTGYKYSREDFVKLIQSNDKVLNRAFEFAQSSEKPYKKDINSFALLVGRTKTQGTQPEPVATEQTAKAEPTTTEPAKVEPTKVEPQATETVTAKVEEPVKEPVVEEKPAIQVKEVEAPKEEVVKKEIPKESLNQNIIPITEKTEVKAVEPTSDKMVVKSNKKEEEFECPPGEKGCLKNQDVVDNYVTNNYRKNNLNYAAITDSEGRLAEFIDGGGGYGKSMTDFYKDEDYEHNKKGFMYAAEELPKSKRFSVFDIKLYGKDKSVIYDNKTGVILESTDDVIKNKQGDTVKVWLDVPMTGDPSDPYGIIKEEIDAIKGIKKTEEKKPESKLEKYRNYNYKEELKEQQKVKEQPKTEGKPQMEVKDVTKEEPKNLKVKSLDEKVIEENKKSMEYPTPPSETVFDVKKIKGKELYSSYDKENNKWYTYPVGSNKKEWTEVKSGQMKSALNAMFTSNKLDTLKLESKAKEIKADIPKFNINDPNEIYKPYGEEGPDVYYSKENDQYIVKDGEKRNIIEKDSGEYALINSRIKNAIDNSKLGKGECPERQGGCSKNKSTVDEYRYKKAGLKHQDETYIDHNNKPSRITKTVYTKDKKYGNGAWITDREGNLASYIDDSGDAIALTDRYYSEYYNHEEDALFYVAEEAPKSKRFPVYKPFGENGKSFIYDNNTGIIMRELTEDKIMSKDGSPMTVWKDIPMFEPEYKKAKAIIEGLKFQKEKGSKNTFVPLTTTPGMQDWSPIPNKK